MLIVCLMFGTACGDNNGESTSANGSVGDQQEAAQTQTPQKAQTDPAQAEKETATDLLRTLSTADEIGPGCEWSLMAIARSSMGEEPEALFLYTQYQESLRVLVKRTDGVLDEDRPTDNAKAAIVLHMTGADPTDIEGVNLLTRLDDNEAVQAQGINAEIWALIASAICEQNLDNTEKYIQDICDMQGSGGGITYDGVTEDVDITAMAVQALALYAADCEDLREVLDAARAWLAVEQDADGGYGNAESTAQVILALSSLGEDPEKAADFTKDGITLYDGLMRYRAANGFCHVVDVPEADPMATEQSSCALDAIVLAKSGRSFFE